MCINVVNLYSLVQFGYYYDRMKVLMNMWPYFLLNHVGDYYANTEIAAMRKQYPEIEFKMIDSLKAIMIANVRVIILRLAHMANITKSNNSIFQPLYNLQCSSYIPSDYLRSERPDLIFAHSHIPRFNNKYIVPLVAIEYIASERYMKCNKSFHCLSLEIQAKRLALKNASVVITTTPSSKERMEKYIPELRGNILQVPIYMPYIEPVNLDHVENKFRNTEIVKILFVGGAAKRKGLIQLLNAIDFLEISVRKRIELNVVSNFQDGVINGVENSAKIYSNIDRNQLSILMRESHVFALPTQYETFGRVIVEAMANGCAIITSNTDPQDWIVDYGKTGMLVDPASSEDIADGITKYVNNPKLMIESATNSLDRFKNIFYHREVAKIYRSAFETAIKK